MVSWNKTHINTLCLNPETMGAPYVDQLQSICEEFPYAGLFSLAYLEALYRTEDIRLAQAIPKHAFRISNRIKLYTLLHQVQEHTSPVLEDLEYTDNLAPISEPNHANPVSEELLETAELEHAADPLEALIEGSAATARFLKEFEQPVQVDEIEHEPLETEVIITTDKEPRTFTAWLKG